MTSSWLLTSTPFRRRAFGKKGRRRRRRKRNGSSGGEKAWSLLLLLFPRRRLGARGSRRHHISLYTLYTTQKRIRSRVFFWCVFGELFFFGERFFFLFFCTFFVKNTTNTFDFRQTHTTKQRSAEVVCVSARVCGVIVV